MSTAEKREGLKKQLAAVSQSIDTLKLILGQKSSVELVSELKALKRERHRLQNELSFVKGMMERTETTLSLAFFQAAKRLLPAQVYREVLQAARDYREMEDDAEVEQMFTERREYVEEAVRGVKY